jgi:hypothetical protein
MKVLRPCSSEGGLLIQSVDGRRRGRRNSIGYSAMWSVAPVSRRIAFNAKARDPSAQVDIATKR